MLPHVQHVILRATQPLHDSLAPMPIGRLLGRLPLVARSAVAIAFGYWNRSRGRGPAWLDQASDIRLLELTTKDAEVLFSFSAPSLALAVATVYGDRTWRSHEPPLPLPDDTVFDLLGDVLTDVRLGHSDSVRFDPRLLSRLLGFRQVLEQGPFTSISMVSRRFPAEAPAELDMALIEGARRLLERTPVPQRVRIVGRLDALVASTQQFVLALDDGSRVAGVFPIELADTLAALWNSRVLVAGRAVYRASGALLRIDADTVRSGDDAPAVFSRLPLAPQRHIDSTRLCRPQGPRSGVNAILGHWPGAESDAEIEALLDDLS